MVSAVDHLEGALELMSREEIARLSPARRERLRETLLAWSWCCADIDRKPFARPALRARKRPASGVLAELGDGERSG